MLPVTYPWKDNTYLASSYDCWENYLLAMLKLIISEVLHSRDQ